MLPTRPVAEYRWLVCAGAGCALYFALPNSWGGSGRAAAAWIAAVVVFLAWTVFVVGGARPERLLGAPEGNQIHEAGGEMAQD